MGKMIFTLFSLAFLGLSTTNVQVGNGTTDPKTTLQAEGSPTNTINPDGVRAPVISLAQLEAKITAYGNDQNGAIVYIDDVTVASSETETAKIKHRYYIDRIYNLLKYSLSITWKC